MYTFKSHYSSRPRSFQISCLNMMLKPPGKQIIWIVLQLWFINIITFEAVSCSQSLWICLHCAFLHHSFLPCASCRLLRLGISEILQSHVDTSIVIRKVRVQRNNGGWSVCWCILGKRNFILDCCKDLGDSVHCRWFIFYFVLIHSPVMDLNWDVRIWNDILTTLA